MHEATERPFEIPYVDPKGAGPTAFMSTEIYTSLKESIVGLSFTPIIGTEPSMIDRKSTLSWRQMADEMREMLCTLSDKLMYDYMSSLMDDKGASDATPCAGSRPVTRDVDWVKKMKCLREELIRLAHSANAMFGDQMHKFAVTETASYSVLVSSNPHGAALTEYMVRACLAALQLKRAGGEGREDMCQALDLPNVYNRLLDLAAKFMGGQIPAVDETPFSKLAARRDVTEEEMREVRQDLLNVQVENPCACQLFLYQLGWLADMVFHSFSFDGEFYPTDDELSFRAALHVSHSDQRPPSISAFEKGWTILRDKIETWYKQFQAGYTLPQDNHLPNTSKMKNFYKALARVLMVQDVKHRTNGSKYPFEPIAFSLSLDRELENALESLGVDRYYVAMPVEATTEPDPVNQQISHHHCWLLAEFRKENSEYAQPKWQWLSDDFGSGRVDRPLVVKLHGSPLHPLPEPVSREALEAGLAADEIGSQESASCIAPPPSANYVYTSPLRHLFTLSETSYLHNLIVIRSLPQFFDLVYQGGRNDMKRHFYFLGLSTSEWSTRLRMSDIVFPMAMGSTPPRKWFKGRVMRAINEEFDDYRSAILRSLGIGRWYGPLHKVGEKIMEFVPEIK